MYKLDQFRTTKMNQTIRDRADSKQYETISDRSGSNQYEIAFRSARVVGIDGGDLAKIPLGPRERLRA